VNFIPNVSLDIPGFKKKGSEFPVVSFKFTHKMMVNFFCAAWYHYGRSNFGYV